MMPAGACGKNVPSGRTTSSLALVQITTNDPRKRSSEQDVLQGTPNRDARWQLSPTIRSGEGELVSASRRKGSGS